ncbi:hypothetical protein ACVIW3_001311 [Bradyrhizobium diazoefficiens]
MFDSDRMSEELRTLKVDVTRLLSTAGEEMFESSKDRAEALADQIKWPRLPSSAKPSATSRSSFRASSRSAR